MTSGIPSTDLSGKYRENNVVAERDEMTSHVCLSATTLTDDVFGAIEVVSVDWSMSS